MEHVDPPDLAGFVAARSPLPRDQARVLLAQLFEVVSRLHAAGDAHGQLRPENIEIKVVNGAPAIELSHAAAPAPSPWTAPEQSVPGDVSKPAADVWALGLLSYFVLTGETVREGAHEPAPGFDDWLARATNADPARRFSSAAEAWSSLQRVLDSEGRRERGRPVERTGLLLVAVIGGCVAMGYAIYALISSAKY